MPITRSRLLRNGNSTGLTLSRDVLDAAGMDRGQDVQIEASAGRIVITPAEGTYSRAMAAFERSIGRYGRTYALLAR